MDSAQYRAVPMIRVTRLNHVPLILNSDLIEHIDMTPDTIVTLTSGQKFMVLESAEEVVEKVIRFRRQLNHPDASRLAAPVSPELSETEPPVHGR
jgi:flagellar protein FlbD